MRKVKKSNIGNKEKLSIFTDSIVLYTENLKTSTRNPLNIQSFRVQDKQKISYFSQASNSQSKKELRKQLHFSHCQKHKILENNIN